MQHDNMNVDAHRHENNVARVIRNSGEVWSGRDGDMGDGGAGRVRQ